MSTLSDIDITLRDINQTMFWEKSPHKKAVVGLDKGNQTQGQKHRVLIQYFDAEGIELKGKDTELFTSPSLKGILHKLEGFEIGIRQYRS